MDKKKGELKKSSERKEALLRLAVLLVTGLVVYLWGYVSYFLMLINWIVALITGARNQAIAEFIENWTSTMYYFTKYLSGMSNERPFPFNKIKIIGKFEP